MAAKKKTTSRSRSALAEKRLLRENTALKSANVTLAEQGSSLENTVRGLQAALQLAQDANEQLRSINEQHRATADQERRERQLMLEQRDTARNQVEEEKARAAHYEGKTEGLSEAYEFVIRKVAKNLTETVADKI